jgi:hypothetical protein
VERTLEFWREALPQLPNVRRLFLKTFTKERLNCWRSYSRTQPSSRRSLFRFRSLCGLGQRLFAERLVRIFPGKVFELHLHDNHGDEDSHMAIGEGSLNFKGLIDAIAPFRDEVIYTIEGTPRNDAISYEYIRKNFP